MLTAISFALSLLLLLSGILETFELKAFDLYSRLLNPEHSSPEIVIIQIDQGSIEALSEQGINWPWPRQMYVPIVAYLSEADAVFMDILFTEPSSYGEEDDELFAEVIREASNVYLPVFLSEQELPLSEEDEKFIKRIAIEGENTSQIRFNTAITPIDELKRTVNGSGNVTISPDDDGVYRKIPLTFRLDRYTVPHFVLSYLLGEDVIKIQNGSLFSRSKTVPLEDGKLLLRYYRKRNPFRTFSAFQIFNAYLDSQSSTPPSVKKEFFKGKKVLIGLTAAGLYDLRPTPIASVSTGALIHATTLDNLINQRFFYPASVILIALFMLLICYLTSYAVIKSYSLAINLSVFTLLLVSILVITSIFFWQAIYLKIIPLITASIVSFIGAVAYSYATEGRERQTLRKTFLQYMDTKVAEHLLENPSLIKPGGKKRRVTVFFADMADFTTISELITPEEVGSILHRVLNSLTEIIIASNGVIDKYIGDCVMAFWGAPLDTEEDEQNACLAAVRCQEAVNEINRGFRENSLPEISIRIGIHTGDVLAGNLGSDRVFHYTVIGDTVNLASRLEAANKFFGTGAIASVDTVKAVDEKIAMRELGSVAVKGKTKPVKIFELIGERRNIRKDKLKLMHLFERATALYRERNWKEALEMFEEILEELPDDGPSEFYRLKCEYMLSHPNLTEDWKIIRISEK